MTAAHRLLFAGVFLAFAAVAGGVGYAEDTQDSPLYAYTLQTALDGMQSRDLPAVLPEPGGSVPEVVQAQTVTSEPHFNTICHVARTECPHAYTACPPQVATACPPKSTFCPSYATMCPGGPTACPVLSTRCPGGPTNCPIVRTQCPALLSACPANSVTTCPQGRTNCPAVATQCPKTPTLCPPGSTNCPAVATQCPMAKTNCPQNPTICPPQAATVCPLQRTQCPNRLTACPSPIPTACPIKATQCPVQQTTCPGGTTNCPAVDTTCPVRATVCPAPCVPGPGGPQMSFLQPTGDPTVNASAELSFDASDPTVAPFTPSVCSIRVRLTVNAPGVPNIQNSVRVCIDPVGVGGGASLLTWQYSAGVFSPWVGSANGRPPQAHASMGKAVYDVANDWYEVSAIFTNLPDVNSAFGAKRIYAQIVDAGGVVLEVQQPIEVFYDRMAFNNPVAALGDPTLPNYGPNWFYYWKTGAVVANSAHDWQYENMVGLYGYYQPGEDHVNLGPLAQDLYPWAPETFFKDDGVTSVTVTGQGRGPIFCAEVVAHEGYHKSSYEIYGPLIALAELDGELNGDPYDDPDDDGVPNAWEPVSPMPLDAPTLNTDPNDADTYNLAAIFGPASGYDLYGDEEVRCRALSMNPTRKPVDPLALTAGGLTVNRLIDWSYGGRNSVPPTPPAFAPVPPLWWTPWP